MTKHIKFTADHFPAGTIVEIKTPSPWGENEFFQVEIHAVIRRPTDNALLVQSNIYDDIKQVNNSWRVEHVSKIIKRGSGKVTMEVLWCNKPSSAPPSSPFYSRGYYITKTMGALENTILRVIEKVNPEFIAGRYGERLDNMRMNDDIRIQSFCMETMIQYQPDGVLVRGLFYRVNKKRLDRFVRKNWRRWLMTRKQINEAVQAYQDSRDEELYSQQAHAEYWSGAGYTEAEDGDLHGCRGE